MYPQGARNAEVSVSIHHRSSQTAPEISGTRDQWRSTRKHRCLRMPCTRSHVAESIMKMRSQGRLEFVLAGKEVGMATLWQ